MSQATKNDVHEYGFDVVMSAAVRVKARSEAEAIKLIAETLDCVTARLGTWPNGEPIMAEVSTDARGADIGQCYEIDGQMLTRQGVSPAASHPKG